MNRIPPLACLLFVAMLVSVSCSVREQISIDGEGSGAATVSVNLSPILVAYYGDLITAVTDVEGDYPIFDLDQLRAAFAERPAVQLQSIERSDRGKLRMQLQFDDVNEVFAQAAGEERDSSAADVFSFKSNGARRELTVTLDRDAVNNFLSFAPPESAMMMQFLLPPDDGSVTTQEYREELAWALEDYAPGGEVERVLDQAVIEVVVTPKGRIESQTGGTLGNGTVTFRIPILELLTLDSQRVYRVVFVP